MNDPGIRRGILMVTMAGVCWSLQGLTIRLIEVARPEQIVFWRSVSQFFVLFLLLALFNRGRVLRAIRAAGAVGLLGGGCVMVAGTCFVFGVSHTTVANVVFVLAASPLLTSLLAWVFLKEAIPARSLTAMLIAVFGIGVMVAEGGFEANLTGTLFALGAAIGFSGIAVVARWGRGMSMFPATCWGALGTMAVAWLLCRGDVQAPMPDVVWAMVSGGVLTASGATLFLLGARYVPAGLLTFLTLTEVVLAPIWVWIGFGEIPSSYTLAGGVIVLGAIVAEALVRSLRPQS